MLQRAASNAYSWWWASHIRTKQSKWLEENLQDMEEKVTTMMKIIENNGNSFFERVEMYYKRRPELIVQVEESYRAYRALAERYELLSKEMQRANRTIAAVFPEQIQLAMDDDDDDDDDDDYGGEIAGIPIPVDDPNDACTVSKGNIPKVPALPMKELRSPSVLFPRKDQQRMNGSVSLAPKPGNRSSGLTHEEASEEVDRIQKDILALQTEKEFMQSICQRCSSKCSGIESKINDMQARVCSLQDEFRIGNFIDDDEARILMAATALKSCKETLGKLQEKQEESAEEAKVENLRVKDLVKTFSNLQGEVQSKQTDPPVPSDEEKTEPEESEQPADVESQRQKVKKELEADSGSFFTVMQLAERIDELVEKVIRLETEVSSQNALIKVLRSEADGFQERIRTLEEEKETLMENSEIMAYKIKELEEELRRVKSLNQKVKEQHENLQTSVTEASCKIDYLSEKLENVKKDEAVDNSGMIQEEQKEDVSSTKNSFEEKEFDSRRNLVVIPGKHLEDLLETGANVDSQQEGMGIDGEEDQPNWKHMLAGGLEEREKHLVEEYRLVLRSYGEVKKKLGDVEKKNRDGFFELTMQIRDLKNALAMKDEEIQILRKTNSMQKGEDENPPSSPETIRQAPSIPDTNQSTLSSPLQQSFDSEHDEHLEEPRSITSSSSIEDVKISTSKETRNARNVDMSQVASAIEEKLRSDIDGLLEENLEFWLRFSTSFHQIHKYQNAVQDLKAELSKMSHSKMKDGSGKGPRIMSDARPIYRHLREIQTELTLWLESNSVLKDEQHGRYASLCSIQEEVSRISQAISNGEEAELSDHQVAKFQGEILNMKQESNKVSDEIRAVFKQANVLKDEVEKILLKMDEELGLSAAKHKSHHHHRVPLRSFLFGVKLKTHKRQKSLLSCTLREFHDERHDDLPVAGHQP